MVFHATVADFIVFLFVHVSQADDRYDPAELQTIKTKIKGLFPEGTDLEKKLYNALREYKTVDKSNLTALIEATVKHFEQTGQWSSYDIVPAMQEIVQADGQVEQSETRALEALQKIMDHASL